MPKKKGGSRRKKRNGQTEHSKHKLEEPKDGQVIARVIKRCGGSRLEVECNDGKIRSASIPGRMRRRVWMNEGDILLCTVDSLGKDKACSIECKYNQNDIHSLEADGYLTFALQDDEHKILKVENKLTNHSNDSSSINDYSSDSDNFAFDEEDIDPSLFI